MAIRLVALDLDGTLLTSKKTISRRTHTALAKVRDRGIAIVLATARPPRSVRKYYEHLKLTAPTINYNGALIWDEPRKKVIRHIPLAADEAREVIAYSRKRYKDMIVSVEILDKWYTDHAADIPEYATETSKHFTPDFVGPLEAFLTVPITKLMLMGPPPEIVKLEKRLEKNFGERIAHTRSDAHMLQVLSPHVNKGEALAAVAEELEVERDEILAIGDAPNDVEMLMFAGLGIAPANGWDEAKGVAQHVVASNDEDGVADALERFVLRPNPRK